jgi:hypothetical protein
MYMQAIRLSQLAVPSLKKRRADRSSLYLLQIVSSVYANEMSSHLVTQRHNAHCTPQHSDCHADSSLKEEK